MKTQALRDGLNCDINVLFSKGDLAEAERIRAALRYIDAHDDLVKALQAVQKLLTKDLTYVGATAVIPFESHDQAINHTMEARELIKAALSSAGAA